MQTNSANIERSGKFIQGTDALFFFSFPNLTGELFDPSDITIIITDPTGTTIDSGTAAEKVETGQYAYSWSIPNDATPGLYTITVNFVIEQDTGPQTSSFEEKFVVTESSADDVLDPKTVATVGFLESLLGYAQRIPVFREPGRLNKTRDLAEFTFPRWNQPAGTKIYLNGNLWTEYSTVDWLKGKIEFDHALSKFDEITADYNFRWFTDNELYNFIAQGIQIFNQYVPHSAYQLYNLPERYFITSLMQAAVFAIRRLMTDLMFQEPIKVFGGPEGWDGIMNRWNQIKENYEKDLTELYKQKKFQPYLGRTKTILVPEYTLPGGRCLSYNSLIKYKINNDNIEIVDTRTIEYVYTLFSKGNIIFVLSDNNGELKYEKVHKIWESGEKDLIRITEENSSYIDVSEDHIVFVNDIEVNAGSIKINDILTIEHGNKITQSKVKSIEQIKKQKTYDIEVPSTENLFVNHIKCHNSRWFRYIFKGA